MNHPIDFLAIILCIFPVITYSIVFWRQYSFRDQNRSLYPMSILNIRSASLLPLFAIIITITVWAPNSFQAFVPLEAALEGYAVMTFFALIVLNCGGSSNVVKILGVSDRIACCDCQRNAPINCYKRVCKAVWQFVYIRPLVATIGAFVFYCTEMDGLFLIIQGICFLQTAGMLVGLLSLAYTLYEDCIGLNIVYKLFVIKISVGLVVIQGFVIDNLYTYGYISIPDKYSYSDYSEDSKIQRAYCLLCLTEFVILCIPLWFGFGYPVVASKYFRAAPLTGIERDTVVGLPTDARCRLVDDEKNILVDNFESDSRESCGIGEFLCDIVNIFRYSCEGYISIATGMPGS